MANYYFNNLRTVAETKSEYRRLCFLHHPDRGGNTATMQDINSQYHAKLSACNGETSTGSDNKEHTYRYNRDTEQAIIDKIAEIVSVGMVNVEIMLIGSWVWITGETKRYKDQLGKNGLKCRWHSKRLCWYWHIPSNRKCRYNSKVDLDGLAVTYGYSSFDSDKRVAISA